MTPAAVVEVVAALIERPGSSSPDQAGRGVFLARRAANLNHGGLWELPGGKVEAGEEPAAALVREIREELGLEAHIVGPASVHEMALSGKTFRFHVYPTVVDGPPRRLEAHDAWRYVGPEEICSLELAPLDGPALSDWIAVETKGK
jgi:8-oxo-dGTP diphosphatase